MSSLRLVSERKETGSGVLNQSFLNQMVNEMAAKKMYLVLYSVLNKAKMVFLGWVHQEICKRISHILLPV
jgi:hypothetical protein